MNNNATQKVLYMFLLWHYIWEAIFFSGGRRRVNELRSGWLKLALRASLSSTFMCQKRKRCQTWSKKLKKFLARTKEKITHKTEPNWTVCHYVHKANVSPKPKCVSKLILNDLKYKHIYFLLFVCSSLVFFSVSDCVFVYHNFVFRFIKYAACIVSFIYLFACRFAVINYLHWVFIHRE